MLSYDDQLPNSENSDNDVMIEVFPPYLKTNSKAFKNLMI